MFLLGLYLYMLVVETFSGDGFNFKTYAFIGWGKIKSCITSYVYVFFDSTGKLEIKEDYS